MRRFDVSSLSAVDRELLKARQDQRLVDFANGVYDVRPASPARRAKVRARMAASAKPVTPYEELLVFVQLVQAVEDAFR